MKERLTTEEKQSLVARYQLGEPVKIAVRGSENLRLLQSLAMAEGEEYSQKSQNNSADHTEIRASF